MNGVVVFKGAGQCPLGAEPAAAVAQMPASAELHYALRQPLPTRPAAPE